MDSYEALTVIHQLDCNAIIACPYKPPLRSNGTLGCDCSGTMQTVHRDCALFNVIVYSRAAPLAWPGAKYVHAAGPTPERTACLFINAFQGHVIAFQASCLETCHLQLSTLTLNPGRRLLAQRCIVDALTCCHRFKKIEQAFA